MQHIRYIIIVLSLLVVGGCNNPESTAEDAHTHDAEHDDHGHESEASEEEVHLVQRQMDVMDIGLGQFQELNLSTTVKANGELELPPQNRASLSAVLGGRVKSIQVVQGDFVTKGQTLAMLEDPTFVDLQREYMTAHSQLTYLEKDFERKKSLYSDSLSSEKAFQAAESEYRSALAATNGLRAKLQLLDINVKSVEAGNFMTAVPLRSPIKGFVRFVEIDMGKYVEPQQELFEIVDNDHIHIDLMVYEKDLHKVQNGQEVIFSLSSHPDSVYKGSVFSIGKSFEDEPKAMFVHAEIENKRGTLLPGMYVDARIITNTETVRALPNDAIVNDGGLSYIFVLKPGGGAHVHADGESHEDEFIFRKIEVNTGASDIGFTEVVPAYNLPDHIQVVTKGAFYLLAEMKKGSGGHGHHH